LSAPASSPSACTACGPFQPEAHFGRILAAYGGVFVAASLAWGMAFDGFRPDCYDLVGAALCLAGVAVIMYAPRAG
jgi:small multidrug resistance family-3 protein